MTFPASKGIMRPMKIFYFLLILFISTFPFDLFAIEYRDTTILHTQKIVLFDSDKWDVRPEYQSELDTLISKSISLTNPKLVIRAHTDDQGSDAYNVELSKKRAITIKDYLVNRGMPDSCIQFDYLGETDHITSNATSDGRARNRRATILLYAQEKIEETAPTYLVEGQTIDIKTKEGIRSNLIISGKGFQDSVPTTPDGLFELHLPQDIVFKIRAFSDTYIPLQKMLKTESYFFETPLILELSQPKKRIHGHLLTGRVTDDSTYIGLPAKVIVRGQDFRDSTICDANGVFEIEVPKNTILAVDVLADGYFFGTKMIKSGSQLGVNMKFQLPRIRTGKNFIMEVLFVGNSPQVLPESVPLLYNLLEVVRSSIEYCFKIDGHVNVPRSPRIKKDSWSFKLSERRAEAIFDYLVSNGIDRNRLAHEGFGNWFMVHPNAILESQQRLNRRVEIRIVECN